MVGNECVLTSGFEEAVPGIAVYRYILRINLESYANIIVVRCFTSQSTEDWKSS